jgi:chromosome segregation ATPase
MRTIRVLRAGAAVEATLKEVIDRLGKAMDVLENAAMARIEQSQDYAEAEAEVQRMNADRSRLAQELDASEARAERLQDANKEVSRRLVTAMETIRAVLDR